MQTLLINIANVYAGAVVIISQLSPLLCSQQSQEIQG